MKTCTAEAAHWDPQKLVYISASTIPLRFFRGLPRYLASHGLELHVVASPEQPLWDFCRSEGCTPHAVPMSRSITPLWDAVSVSRLCRMLRRIRPAIVESHMSKAGLVGMMAAWAAGVPIRIYTNHGVAFASATGWKRTLLKTAERLSCRLASHVHCVSRSVRQLMIDEGCCRAEKIRVLANGSCGIDAEGRFNPDRVAANARDQTRLSLGIPPAAQVLGFVGRIAKLKGIDDLARAWQVLRECCPDLHLAIIGSNDPRNPIRAKTDALLRSDPRVHLTGEVADMPAYYRAMDVLVLPSQHEGLPISLLEASAMQLPVVASHIPGNVDAVADGVTGTLVPVHDAAALAAAIRRYLDDPALRQKHGLAGRERARRNFQQEIVWEASCREYVDLLRAEGMYLPGQARPALPFAGQERRAA